MKVRSIRYDHTNVSVPNTKADRETEKKKERKGRERGKKEGRQDKQDSSEAKEDRPRHTQDKNNTKTTQACTCT